MGTQRFSNVSYYEIDVDATVQSQDAGGNFSRIYFRVIGRRLGGTQGYYSGPDGGNRVIADSNLGANPDLWDQSGLAYDFRAGNGTEIIFAQGTFNLPHRADGYAEYFVNGSLDLVSLGYASAGSGWKSAPRIARPPGAPYSIALDQATPSSLRYRFSGTTDGGSPILEWQAQIATDSAFSQNVQTVSSNGTTVFSNLISGTTHRARARGRNAAGWGPWGDVASGSTLPAGAPGLIVIPAPDGASASVQVSPPGGSAGVNTYFVQYRPTPSGSVVQNTSSSATMTVTELTPGASYDWRALARYASYDSPWSTWQTVRQTVPVSNPDAYFDGSQGGRGTRLFSWLGTSHASVSVAQTSVPVGWTGTFGGGTGTMRAAAGGRRGKYAARLTFLTSATTSGATLGLSDRSPVVAEAPYAGSIYVRPSRSQRLAARIYWFDAAGNSLGSNTGGAVVVAAGAWARLVAQYSAPVGAASAYVRAVDVTGAGWSLWLAGQYLDADSAMVSLARLYDYFDGGFLGTPEYSYSWEGPANASPSRRDFEPEKVYVISDPDCAVVPGAPRPPAIVNDCITTEGQWRRFWYSIPAVQVGEWTETLPTVKIRTASSDIGQVRIRFYRNPSALSVEDFDSTQWDGELILSYVPPSAEVTLDGLTQRATADVGARKDVPADHLLYGTNGGVVSWPVLSCGDSYLMSWDIPTSTPSGNVAVELELTQRM